MSFFMRLRFLRKQRGITQEELAQFLYVSRTAVSKWESSRGYPNINSLKAIAKFFGVTVDDLLSGDNLPTISEEDRRQKGTHFHDLVFGMLDCSIAMFFFLPFFGQKTDGIIREVSLLSLTEISSWLQTAYFSAVIGIILCGVLTLALQNCHHTFWSRIKHPLSLLLNAAGMLLFVASLQPYAAAFLFILLSVKTLILTKKQ